MIRFFSAAVLALSMTFGAAAQDAARPDFIPEKDWGTIKNLIDPGGVTWDPYKGLAVKKDGSPYRVLYLPVWMGDDYQVVAQNLLKTQLQAAGATFTMVSAEFDVPTQTRLLEDAIATHAYDAVIMHPIDPTAMASTIDRAVEAGIDVYNWVLPANTDKLTGFAGYDADKPEGNGQIGAKFVELAKASGATPDKPYRVLEIWGMRSLPICQARHHGVGLGLAGSPLVKVVESVDTAGQPEVMTKAIQDAFARYPDIKAIYPQFGDAGAIIEGLRAVDRLAPAGDPNHVVVVLQDIDKAMLAPLRDGTFDYTVSNNPWHQIDVVVKQFLWHTVLKQPLADGDAISGKVKLPRRVLLPMPMLTGKTIDTDAAHMWGGTVAFTDMPLGKWNEWPVLDTREMGLPTPGLDDRKRLLGY
ncbi:sugar ABC transporter substrate-binding protein [Labrys monachus]|uniref:ABC-type sugar transport system substrate-binding protein n=1 Tax=Labrys monachus TaxID=217067 RepID=A0ABU0FIJ6_9HYPH|nr:sugar ABC transporter substrate-binding protein [Labrys monachus]MDQ0394437.1 ABC-type sugar transport system substrate-binding protein [Labrys monachus]